ncbi:MAG: LON peptidase substrate-binding domain-containing protein [Ectothiorhodospiraceae bacterium]|nr:LON peptidase substrate-binding domain-containing protein [Ectothiorhodospiraceae bacterium]
MRVPLFPLRTVLFPGGPLRLRIFETRYLDMVSRCLREDSAFGVCLIRRGQETGRPAEPHAVGTLARIVDWSRCADGLLGLVAIGEQRFRILDTEVGANGLLWGEVDLLEDPLGKTLPEQGPALRRTLDEILRLPGLGYEHITRDERNALWLGCRLAEILPLDLPQRQRLLELDDPLERLRALQPMVPDLRLDD